MKQGEELTLLKNRYMEEIQQQKPAAGPGLANLDTMRAEKKSTKAAPVVEDSKRKLSKLVADFERRLHEEEKKNTKITNKMKQSEADKEKYKQKYSILKN
jgi:hypothetical protein